MTKVDRLVNCSEQIFIAEGLGQKFEGARFHSTRSHWDIAVTSNENNRNLSIAASQFLLQIKATYSR